MSPGWAHPINGDLHDKLNKSFWRDAAAYGQYAFYVGQYVSPVHFVHIDGKMWAGRFSDRTDEVDENILEDGCGLPSHRYVDLFCELSHEAVEELVDPASPPLSIIEPWDQVEIGSNAWLNALYSLFAHEPERWDDPRFPFRLEPGESFSVVGLPCNVFTASARAVEMLAERRATLPLGPNHSCEPQRTTDKETDNSISANRRLPENPDVLRLFHKIKKDSKHGATMKEIALEFTEGDDSKAESLLRQLRRFRQLLQ